MADILVRDLSDAVIAALEKRATAAGMSRQQFVAGELERLALVDAPRATVTLDLRHPQAARFRWGTLHCEGLRLRAANGATATLNAYGSGSAQGMTQEQAEARSRASDHINKARALGDEGIGVDIVGMLESAGWEVFPA